MLTCARVVRGGTDHGVMPQALSHAMSDCGHSCWGHSAIVVAWLWVMGTGLACCWPQIGAALIVAQLHGTCSTGASPLLLPSLPEQPEAAPQQHRHHHRQRERFRWPWQSGMQHSNDSNTIRQHSSQQEQAQQQQQQQEALQLDRDKERLCLSNDNSYLPPDGVLQRSEFLLPPDDATMQLYRWLLDTT